MAEELAEMAVLFIVSLVEEIFGNMTVDHIITS